KEDYAGAQQALQDIPAPERVGDLAVSAYLLADCLLRQAPAKAEDALAAGKLQEQLQTAAGLLDGFIGAAPKAAEGAYALLKLGYWQQRFAALLAQPQDKANALTAARTAYDRLMQQFPNDALMPQAVLKRAKCLAAAGDKNGAVGELRRFTGDPLQNAAV